MDRGQAVPGCRAKDPRAKQSFSIEFRQGDFMSSRVEENAASNEGYSVFERKPAPHLMRGGYRFA
jgi:hypothetical protein